MKFHTISPEKDLETEIIYPQISIIQVGRISNNFQLNIKASKNFDTIRFDKSWVNYRRSSGALVIKCHGDHLYASRLKDLLREKDYVLITNEGMQEGNYDDELLKFIL